MVAHARIGQDRHVLAFPHHIGLVEGADVVARGDLFAEVVEQHVLKKQHRIVIPNRRLHQPLGVGGCAHGHDLDAGHGVEIGLEPLAVFGAKLAAHATGPPHHGGNRVVAAAGVAQHPHVVGDLVEGEQQEAHVHAFHDRPQTGHGRTHRHAGETVFSDRGIQHPQFAVFLIEILGDLVGAAVLADVLTHHADVGVAGHLFVDGVAQGVEEKRLCHGGVAVPAAAGGAANLSQAPPAGARDWRRPSLSRLRRRWPAAAPKAASRGRAAAPAAPGRGRSWQPEIGIA